MQILQVGNPVEVGRQKKSPEYLKGRGKRPPISTCSHCDTVIKGAERNSISRLEAEISGMRGDFCRDSSNCFGLQILIRACR